MRWKLLYAGGTRAIEGRERKVTGGGEQGLLVIAKRDDQRQQTAGAGDEVVQGRACV